MLPTIRLISLAGVFCASTAFAQVSSINSAVLNTREFNDVPGATLTSLNTYPTLIQFNEVGVSAPTGFADRDVWRFSADSTNPYLFSNNDFFHVSMTLNLTATAVSPRKEAGFLLSTIGGDGQFIVNSDAHEIVAFGGPLPFYAFPSTFTNGNTITLEMTYFLDSDGKRKVIYTANGVNSPAKEFTNLEQGIIDGSRLGGYLQIANAPNDPANSALATFGSISIASVPEPSALGLLALGLAAGLFRKRS